MRNGDDLTISPPGSGSTQPPVVLDPNLYYALSSRQPKDNANFEDLTGGLSPINGTFVLLWDRDLQDFGQVCRYHAGQWEPTEPLIPWGEGAFVAEFNASYDPISLVSVEAAGSCPPAVTLTLTFSGTVDPISMADRHNYVVYGENGEGGGVYGNVDSVVLLPPAHPDGILPTWQRAELHVTLQTQPGNTYYISAKDVTGVGGNPPTIYTLPFNLCSVSSLPPNDSPTTAATLLSGTKVNGSLQCADATPASVVAQFPPGAGANAKDVWYSFTPPVAGNVTINTCQTLASACPQSDTVLAVYDGYPGTLNPISSGPWYDLDMDPSACGLNPKAAQVQFLAQPCTTYYIRVSGMDTGDLPGEFGLLLVHTPNSPSADECLSAQSVSPNSSTAFDNLAATSGGYPSTEAIDYDVWFIFQAPLGGGSATIETCTANFDSALAVYSGDCGSLNLVGYDPGLNCPPHGSSVTFAATGGQSYYIRVGTRSSPTTPTGCGFLHVSCGIPGPGSVPTPGGSFYRMYEILGTPNNIGWTWSLTAPDPCNLNVEDSVPGISSGTAFDIAEAFATSIKSHPPLTATAAPMSPPRSDAATLTIGTPCDASEVVLKVGPSPGTPDCWVDFASLPVAFGPCSFNPYIFQLGNPQGVSLDCNANGQSDALDILLGVSTDADGDGIPDECQGCVRVAIASGPVSTSGFRGGTASFAVQPIGSGPFVCQWRHAGTPLTGQTNATLVLTNLGLDAAGLYDVIVTNACSQTTSPHAVLGVHPQPVLNINQAGTNIVLWWNATEYHPQFTAALNLASWTDVTTNSPVVLPMDSSARFFRLRQNGL